MVFDLPLEIRDFLNEVQTHIYMYIKAKINVFSFSCHFVMDAFIKI